MSVEIVNPWLHLQPFPIDPADVDAVPFDFTEYLSERGATIDAGLDAITFTVTPDTLTEEGKNHTDTVASVRFSGWTLGVDYTITCHITAGAFEASRSTFIECRKL